jgi:predicted ATPase/DNA-binding SARP family transcriptional activator
VLVLGPVALEDGAGPVKLPAMVQRLLAGLVIARGRVCGPDELIDVLWGEAPPGSASKLVRVYVSQLRKVLPAGVAVETVGGGYALGLADGVLDAVRLERLLGECGAARRDGNASLALSLADRALALWRGRAFGELGYEEFALGESERLEELRLVVSEERLDALLALGRHGDALGDALAFAGEHPLRERAHELAMLALYRSGRHAEALEHYAAFRARLDEELGLEPGAGLRELQRGILQQDATLDAASPAPVASDPLPIPPTRLVGREVELRSLREILARREVRLLVLTGAGGSGKTRLAVEIAREVAPTFANGAVLVELAPLSDPELVLPTIAQRLDVAAVPGEELLDTLVEAIRPRELLLLLDNAEHLRDAAPRFAELVARAPRLTLLVTSRAVLHLSGEQVFPVQPLEEEAAVDLFEQRARSHAPGFRPTAEDHVSIAEVCARVDRLPLGIELAAGRIGTLTLSTLRERLGNRLAVLTRGPRDLPARQQTLRETLDWSVDLLTAPERAVLARLAVFPGGASLEAAEAVCSADLDTLTTLVDANLVRRVDVGDDPRFGLLETIREYALELLGDDRGPTERALALYFRDLVEAAYEILTEDPDWLARFDVELDNLRRALDVAAARSDPELELQLAGGLWRFWWTRGYLDEGIGRLEAALGRATEISPARARAARGVAGLAWNRGHFELAVARATETLALADVVGAPYEAVGAHTILGIVANRDKDFETARHHHEQSLAIKQGLGLEPLVERLNLAIVAMDSGDAGAAVPLLENVLESHRRDGNPSGIGFATLNLGLAHYRLGDIEGAHAAFHEAQHAFSQVGFRAHVAHALQGRAACAASSARYAEAARLLGQAAAELGEIVDSDEDFPLLAAEAEAAARSALGDDEFADAHEAGRLATD